MTALKPLGVIETVLPARRRDFRTTVSKKTPVIRIVLVEKSELFCAGLVKTFEGTRFRMVAHYPKLCDLVKRLPRRAGIALVCLDDEDVDDRISVINFLKRDAQHSRIRIIVLSESFCPEEFLAVIEAGADGYLIKSELSPQVLLQSLELVSLGGVVIVQGFPILFSAAGRFPSEGTASDPAAGHICDSLLASTDLARFSAREEMILKELMRGASNKQIARELNIAEATVKVHVKSLLRKIRVCNRTQAAMWAVEYYRKDLDK